MVATGESSHRTKVRRAGTVRHIMDFEKDLKITETNIPGVLVFDLSVHGDNRGWFK